MCINAVLLVLRVTTLVSGSGMEDQSSEVQAPTTPSNLRTPSGQAQVVRMSLRPPSRFSAGANLVLWRKRFELYARQAKIAED